MKEKNKKRSALVAWELFKTTGNISHYLLYKQLDKK